ncbi:Uncharacterised protein [uncultured archaeon]|nr:Uncharacterised protein [uncultured archaeon]
MGSSAPNLGPYRAAYWLIKQNLPSSGTINPFANYHRIRCFDDFEYARDVTLHFLVGSKWAAYQFAPSTGLMGQIVTILRTSSDQYISKNGRLEFSRFLDDLQAQVQAQQPKKPVKLYLNGFSGPLLDGAYSIVHDEKTDKIWAHHYARQAKDSKQDLKTFKTSIQIFETILPSEPEYVDLVIHDSNQTLLALLEALKFEVSRVSTIN